jgi:hypothetical protein
LGILIDLENVKMTAEEIKTYFLSQDHLEMLNGSLRKDSGCSNSPMTNQFTKRMNFLFCVVQMMVLKGNCQLLEHIPTLQVHRALTKKKILSTLSLSATKDDENESSPKEDNDDPFDLIENIICNDYKKLQCIICSKNASFLGHSTIGLTTRMV